MNTYTRSAALLSRYTTRLLVIDVQEKLVPAIENGESVVRNCCDLVAAAAILDVPIVATEQYPKGLGTTVPELAGTVRSCPEKTRFSAAEVLGWSSTNADGTSQHQVVVAGIEAHVCVLQTVLDLLSDGFDVHVAADAIGSRVSTDRETALQRMRDSGATITTTESAIFELCETASAPEFKQISQLIRQRGQ